MKDAVLKTKGADNLPTVNMKGDEAIKQDHQPGDRGQQQDSFHQPEDILELHRVSTDVQGVIETKHEESLLQNVDHISFDNEAVQMVNVIFYCFHLLTLLVMGGGGAHWASMWHFNF